MRTASIAALALLAEIPVAALMAALWLLAEKPVAVLIAGLSLAAVTPAFATDGPPTGPGDGTSRAELTIDPCSMVAGGRGGIGGEV